MTTPKTDATDVVETVANTEKDLLKKQPQSQSPPPQQPPIMTDKGSSDENESLSEASDVAVANLEENIMDDDINAAPMHLHALRIPARLRGANPPSSTSITSDRSRSNSRSRPRSGIRSNNSSRSASPITLASMEGGGGGASSSYPSTPVHKDASSAHSAMTGTQSAHSSLDGIFDPDIFLDRLGFIDLDPPLPHEIRLGPLAAPSGSTSTSLTSVNERLSEETLEDSHAFQDLVAMSSSMSRDTMSMPSVAHSSVSGVRSVGSVGSLGSCSLGKEKGRHSREGSVAGSFVEGDGSVILETLDEIDEDDWD